MIILGGPIGQHLKVQIVLVKGPKMRTGSAGDALALELLILAAWLWFDTPLAPLGATGAADPNAPSGASTADPVIGLRGLVQLRPIGVGYARVFAGLFLRPARRRKTKVEHYQQHPPRTREGTDSVCA